MLEIILAIAVCAGVYRIAENENLSGAIWSGLTVLACLGSLVIPLPFLRVILAGILVFVLMIVYRVAAKK